MAKVLIVDDEESILRSVGALLVSEGHSVEGVMTGEEAIKLLEDRPFDLLVTDIRMSPVDGIELMQRCRQILPDLPVIVVSALSSDEAEKMAIDAGCQAYIKKPFRINDVIEAVNRVLGAD